MLTRIYGTAWPTEKELKAYLRRLEEARARDHRKLGRELDLFSVSEEVGPGLILWHPKGAMIRVQMEDFSRQAHLDNGYEWVFSPHVGRAGLWETSGHLDFYAENMFAPMDIEGESYYAKPMNCPFHIQIFKSQMRSYRDLPARYAEFGTVYRYERSGVLHGLPGYAALPRTTPTSSAARIRWKRRSAARLSSRSTSCVPSVCKTSAPTSRPGPKNTSVTRMTGAVHRSPAESGRGSRGSLPAR